MEIPLETIAVIGGTGKEGKGLAYCWARAGYRVLIGSRQAEKALAAAADVQDWLGKRGQVAGMTNPEAALAASILVVTVPFSVHKEMFESLKPYTTGKLVVDVTVPLVPPKVTKVQLPPAGSAAQEAQQILGEGVEVVSAFQNISYEHLTRKGRKGDEAAGPRQGAEAAGPRQGAEAAGPRQGAEAAECDVLVCGTSKAARSRVIELVRAAGLVGWDAGPLENSVVAEGLTSILIGLNRQFGVQSAGIRITGIPRGD